MSDSVQPHRQQPTRVPHPWDFPGKNTGVGCHFLLQCMKVNSESEVTQSCPTLSNPMDCRLPGSSVHGIFQARVLEWGAIAFSGQVVIFKKEKKVKRKTIIPFSEERPTEGNNFINQFSTLKMYAQKSPKLSLLLLLLHLL